MVPDLDLQRWQHAINGITAAQDELSSEERSAFRTLTTLIDSGNVETSESSGYIYKSEWYNYNHLLHVQTTPQNLFDKTAPLEVLFYTFIPNHNIKNL